MAQQDIAAAIRRVEAVLTRRPEAGMHDDAPASARWMGGTRIVASHANGTQVASDMPTELGGTGDKVTPGWLFRAGLAACAATSIAYVAVSQGIELASLDVRAGSRSDTRGMLGMPGADGEPVYPGPSDMQLVVTISAKDVPAARLRALVDEGLRRSPIPSVLPQVTPLAVHVEVA